MTMLTSGHGAAGDLREQHPLTRRERRERPADAESLAQALAMSGYQPVFLVPDDDVAPGPPVPSQRQTQPSAGPVITEPGMHPHAPVHVGFIPTGAREAREVHGSPELVAAQRAAWAAPRPPAPPSPFVAPPAAAVEAAMPVARIAPAAPVQPSVASVASVASFAAPAGPVLFLPADPSAPLPPAPAITHPVVGGALPGWVEMSAYPIPGAYPDRPSGGRAVMVAMLGLVLVGAVAAASLHYFGIVDVVDVVGAVGL